MEFRIKTSETESLQCGYTGKACNTLIKVYYEKESKEHETEWMSRAFLDEANRVINALTAPTKPVKPTFTPREGTFPQGTHLAPAPEQKPQAIARTQVAPKFKDNPEVVKQFEGAVLNLKKNPPPNAKHVQDGRVPETAIRELIKRFRPTFQNPNGMFSALNKHFGLPKQRFETLMQGMG